MKTKARKAQAHTKQVERRQRKRAAKRRAYKPQTVPKSERVQRVISRQPQRGMPKLVTQAMARMEARFKLLTLPSAAGAADELAA